jgi:hypothetical protein
VRRIALVLFFAGCSDASFHVQMPQGFHEARAKISVVGVYREGRWSPESFEQLEPAVTSALGPGCAQGYGDALRAADPSLYDEIDQASRQEGVTDDVVARFTAAALGDTLMVLHLYGPVPQPTKHRTPTAANPPPTSRPAYSRGTSTMSGRAPQAAPADPSGFQRGPDVQIAATLFTRKDHAFLGEVALTYNGKDVDAALKRFAARLAEELHGATCAGWHWAPEQPAPGGAEPARDPTP